MLNNILHNVNKSKICTKIQKVISCENEFELVVRASKLISLRLENNFASPRHPSTTLLTQVKSASVGSKPLPSFITFKIAKLISTRNSLVHNVNFNQLNDKSKFISTFVQIIDELDRLHDSEVNKKN